MALIIRDSFDFYAAGADGGTGGFWNTFSPDHLDKKITRFGSGQSFSCGTMQQSIGSNQATLFFTFPFYYNQALSGSGFLFAVSGLDTGTYQCTCVFSSDGAMRVYRGSEFGTLLATFTGVFSAFAWTQIQVKVIIDSSAGEVHVRLNGATADDFAATGLNNQQSGNNWATDMKLGGGQFSGPNNNMFVDDTVFHTGSGGTPWNDWIGDVRAYILMPNAATAQADFSNSGSPISDNLGAGTGGTAFLSSNQQTTIDPAWPAQRDGSIGSMTVNFSSSGTGNCKMAIYDASGAGGSPGALLATSNQVTNPPSGVNTFTFSSPLTITHGVKYWFVMLADFGPQLVQQGGFGNSFNGYTQNQTYGSGLTNPMSGSLSTSLAPVDAFAIVTVTDNFQYVQDIPQDGGTSYVQDSTVGDNDLYDCDDLVGTPNILGVSIRAFAQKDNGGGRSGAVQVDSGGTTVVGTSTPLSTTWSNLFMIQDVDPNTSAQWTASGVNAAQIGPKVTA